MGAFLDITVLFLVAAIFALAAWADHNRIVSGWPKVILWMVAVLAVALGVTYIFLLAAVPTS